MPSIIIIIIIIIIITIIKDKLKDVICVENERESYLLGVMPFLIYHLDSYKVHALYLK